MSQTSDTMVPSLSNLNAEEQAKWIDSCVDVSVLDECIGFIPPSKNYSNIWADLVYSQNYTTLKQVCLKHIDSKMTGALVVAAAQNNDTETLDSIRRLHPDFILKSQLLDEFNDACRKGDVKTVELLLPFMDGDDSCHFGIKGAAVQGRIQVLDILLNRKIEDPPVKVMQTIVGISALDWAAESKQNETVKWLLSKAYTPVLHKDFLNAALCGSARSRNYDVIDWLIDSEGADTCYLLCGPIVMASKPGYLDTLKFLLSKISDRRKRAEAVHEAFLASIRQKAKETVDYLLANEKLNFCYKDDEALILASGVGNLKLVDLLLKDKYVHANSRDNAAIIVAVEENHIAVVDRLLQETCIDPTQNENQLFLDCCMFGYLEMAMRFLQEPGVQKDLALGMEYAALYGHIEVLKYLMELCLKDDDCQPNSNDLIYAAVKSKNPELIQLMKDFIDENFVDE